MASAFSCEYRLKYINLRPLPSFMLLRISLSTHAANVLLDLIVTGKRHRHQVPLTQIEHQTCVHTTANIVPSRLVQLSNNQSCHVPASHSKPLHFLPPYDWYCSGGCQSLNRQHRGCGLLSARSASSRWLRLKGVRLVQAQGTSQTSLRPQCLAVHW